MSVNKYDLQAVESLIDQRVEVRGILSFTTEELLLLGIQWRLRLAEKPTAVVSSDVADEVETPKRRPGRPRKEETS